MSASVKAGERLSLRAVPARSIARLIDAPETALDGAAWLSSMAALASTAPASTALASSALASSPSTSSPMVAPTRTLDAWVDGNRGAIATGHDVVFERRSWHLSVKGVGARAPLYGDSPVGFTHAHEIDVASDAPERALLDTITRESWMGEAPYGGQGLESAENALMLSSPGMREALAPALLCPVIAIVEIPEHEVLDVFHYRRHAGPVVQEHRLVPSQVRLYHQSAIALGRNVEAALEALGVHDVEALDHFLDRYLASALALLTIGARSARVDGAHFELLDYDDAWLDKDAFLCPDGTLAFADLEALVHVEAHDERTLAARVRRQLARNAYEVLYGADALLRVEERWRDRPRDQRQRRRALAERTELALVGDPVLALERGPGGWDLCIHPRVGAPLRARWLDEVGGGT
jgi:hypothetical protein